MPVGAVHSGYGHGAGRPDVARGEHRIRASRQAFGFPFDHRTDRFEEALRIIPPLLRGERVRHHGTSRQFNGAGSTDDAPCRQVRGHPGRRSRTRRLGSSGSPTGGHSAGTCLSRGRSPTRRSAGDGATRNGIAGAAGRPPARPGCRGIQSGPGVALPCHPGSGRCPGRGARHPRSGLIGHQIAPRTRFTNVSRSYWP